MLRLRPYSEIATSHTLKTPITVLPGRLAAVSHPQNTGLIHLPERESYAPDIATVVSSGIRGFSRGEHVVLVPEHGTFYDDAVEGGLELRMVGVIKPWWESIIGKWGEEGFAAAPGWLLVERDAKKEGVLQLTDKSEKWEETGYVVSDCAPEGSLEGERIVFTGSKYYEFDSCLPESFCVVKHQNCPKSWMRSLESCDKVYV